MRKFILLLFVFFICGSITWAQSGKTYHVTSSTLNLRTEPTQSSEVVEQLNKNDNLIIISDSITNWYKVQHNDSTGYVYSEYIAPGKCVVTYYDVRTGAVCKDGSHSSATGRGACSHHGGVSYWKTSKRETVRIVND